MKKLFISFSLLCMVYYAYSQGSQPYKYLGSYTQPAPNAAALGKYVDYPVSYYTGTPSVSIPLYDLKDGGVSTSISLSYHPSGIRVSEVASWVGIGWALQAGGMITRSVRGGPDEGVANPQHKPFGYYVDSGIRKMPMFPYPVNGVFASYDPMGSDREHFMASVAGGFSDTEPDLFTFNFGGYGGKFVFDENRTPRLLSDQDIKIAVNFTSGFNYWIITTPDGLKYYFGENSMYEVNGVFTTGGQDYNSLKPSSWMLTKIVNPNTKDTIYYNYTPETYSYFDLGGESKIFDGSTGDNSAMAACTPTNYPITSALKTTVSGLRLTNIVSRNFKIAFGVNTSSARQDLISSASNYPYKLDSIKIYNSQNQCMKQFVLAYDYFSSTTANQLSTPILGFIAGDISDTKRLKLLSVMEYSGDGSINKPSYNFTYQETYQLPRRLSFDQDHWGYSNNYWGNINNKLTPAVYHPVCAFTGGGAIRNPQWPDMQSYTIKSIRDPLGAITNFEFEAHTASWPYSTVGGLRIKKITNIDSVTGTSKIRAFTYENGGVLTKNPQYLFLPENEYYFRTSGLPSSAGASYQGYVFNSNRIISCAIRQSQSIVPLQDFQGNHIGYYSVKETFGANGEGGYKNYWFAAGQMPQNGSRLHMDNYTAFQYVTSPTFGSMAGIFGNGHFNDIAPQNLTYFFGFTADMYYPNAPLQVDSRHGQLLREETFDSAGTILNSVQNVYRHSYNENYWIRGFKVFQSAHYTPSSQEAHILPSTNDALTFYKLHTSISHLVSSHSIDYKDGKKFISTVNYGYESPYHTSKTSDTAINSIGDSIITKTYYSFDYANGATGDNIFGKMKARNMLLPVAQRVWKNNQLISGSVTLYKDFASNAPDTFINPSKIYSLEISSPLTTGQAGENIAFTSQFNTLLPNAYFKEKANFNVNGLTGKIIEQNLINDKTQALIWDNAYSLPLAQVDNALFADIAYSSFETNEKGNWTYASGSVSPDASAPTGGKAYSLSGGLSKTGFVIGKAYLLSYWLKSGASISISGGTQTNSITGRSVNGWTYKQVTVTATTTTLTLSGSGSIDELRLHPDNAQMTTYTYDSQLRMIAQCSPNGTVSYYAYDSMNRLTDIKDQFGNIVKAFEYNYGRLSRAGQ